MADAVVGFVIDKLYSLLTDEANLLGGIRKEILDIRYELESIQSFLRDADARIHDKDNVDSGMKTWVKQVRELAYQIEDVIDDYMLCVARHHDQRGFLYRIVCFLKKIRQRHEIATKIRDLKHSVHDVKERSDRYNFNSSDLVGGSRIEWHDPRVASLFTEESELVGIEAPRDEMVSILVEGPTKNVVISIVGMGGLGKTTLAKNVYDEERVTNHFDCSAWITVSQSYKMEELLRAMIKKFQSSRMETPLEGIETMEELELISTLREYLSKKRYVVVFDDVWNIEFWVYIKHVLVDKERGSRVIITTRNEEVAPSFKESSNFIVYKLPPLTKDKALELFNKKVFQREGGLCPSELLMLTESIVEKCEGLPLAVVIIGGLLATKDKNLSEWQKLYDGLWSSLASNKRVDSITRILSLSYHDLPHHLKTCFLYFGMFPEDYCIRSSRLIRLWTAEGFIKESQSRTKEEVAKEYLEELINRSLVQVLKVSVDGKVKECRIHDLIHYLILSRSEELKFCQVSNENRMNFKGIGRHLAIHDNGFENLESSIGNSKTRTIMLFCGDVFPKSMTNTLFLDFKLLKVLDFEGAPLNHIPKELCNLFYLVYLSLKGTNVDTLPRTICKLRNLETLDLRRCHVYDIPTEINRLFKLRNLLALYFDFDEKFNANWYRGLQIHGNIGCLKALQKLRCIEVDHDAGLIKNLERLTQMRALGILKLKREDGLALCGALEKMSHLSSLIVSSKEEEFLELQSLSHPPPLLRCLVLRGRLSELPHWITLLNNLIKIRLYWSRLGEAALDVLQSLPNLLELLVYDGYNGEQLHFKAGSFKKLKELRLKQLQMLNTVVIEEGALPSLEAFVIGYVPHLKEVPSGIHSLRNLKNMIFCDIQREFTLAMLPNGGEDYWKIRHIPAVYFTFPVKEKGGVRHLAYKLGDLDLLKYLENAEQNSSEHR